MGLGGCAGGVERGGLKARPHAQAWSLVGPDGELAAAGLGEVETAAAGEAEDVAGDRGAEGLRAVAEFFEALGVDHDERGAGGGAGDFVESRGAAARLIFKREIGLVRRRSLRMQL